MLPCLISHPRMLLPLLLHGAQVAMAVAEPEEFFMSFDFIQFKKERQLEPRRYVRTACMRPCCLMPAGNEHLRPKEHSAFPFTVMCFSRVNTLRLVHQRSQTALTGYPAADCAGPVQLRAQTASCRRALMACAIIARLACRGWPAPLTNSGTAVYPRTTQRPQST